MVINILEQIRKRINYKEIYRYMGYRGTQPEENVVAITEELVEELCQNILPKSIYQRYACEVSDDTVTIMLEGNRQVVLPSANLASNLEQCKEVIVMAATLGTPADQLIRKYSVLNIAKASMVQACASAIIEAYCNQIQEELRVQLEAEQKYLRPRFSPGYGDLAIQEQVKIFELLECAKRLGITLNDSMLMLPTKSVTALIGITDNAKNCHVAKCSKCKNIECEFRYE